MNIDINTKLADVATFLAAANSTTPELYLQGIVEAHLFAALKQDAINKFNSLDVDKAFFVKEQIETQIPAPTNNEPGVIE